MNQAVISNVYRRTTAESGRSRVPARIVDGVLHPKTGLIRIIHFGEALRAVHAYISEDLIARRPEPIVDLLATAFDRLEVERPGFLPEEFSLYFMSILLGLSDDPEEAHKIRIGSARYIVKSASVLPPDFSTIIVDARNLLKSEETAKERRTPARPAPPHRAVKKGDLGIKHTEVCIPAPPAEQNVAIRRTSPPTKTAAPSKPRLLPESEIIDRSQGNRYRRTAGELHRRSGKPNRDTHSRLGYYWIISLIGTITLVSFLLVLGSNETSPLVDVVQGVKDTPSRETKP